MKRAILGAVALATIALLPADSQAQRRAVSRPARPVQLAVGAGVAMPMSDLGDAVGTGFNVAFNGTKKLASAPVWLRGQLDVNMYGTQTISVGGTDYKSSANQIGGLFDVGHDFVSTSSAKPYVLGGLGIIRNSYKQKSGNVSVSGDETELGINVGGGLKFRMGGRTAWLEARYLTAGDYDALPITFGINF